MVLLLRCEGAKQVSLVYALPCAYGPPFLRGGIKYCTWQFSSNGGRARVRHPGFLKLEDLAQHWGRIDVPEF